MKNLHSLALILLGSLSLAWGLWYSIPVFRDAVQGVCSYFEPPIGLGVLFLILGSLSVIPKTRETYRKVLQISHIILWSFMSSFAITTGAVTSSVPLLIIITFIAIFIYVYEEMKGDDF